MPTLVSTLAISCVFTSVIFLEGPAKFLFTPLGFAVVFAMLASYALSRTLTPVIVGLLLKGETHASDDRPQHVFARFHQHFERSFERMRNAYVGLLRATLKNRFAVPLIAVIVIALSGVLLTVVGRDFFPAIDGGQIKLHVRVPAATRIEATEKIFQAVEDKIREVIPERDRDLIVDDIGVPQRTAAAALAAAARAGNYPAEIEGAEVATIIRRWLWTGRQEVADWDRERYRDWAPVPPPAPVAQQPTPEAAAAGPAPETAPAASAPDVAAAMPAQEATAAPKQEAPAVPPPAEPEQGPVILADELPSPQPEPPAPEDSILWRADALTPEPVDWLWKYRIACGGLTLIGGAPGSGKSTVALGLIATVSAGGYWPAGEGRAALGSAILVCEQAALRNTIVPGLMAAGADRSRIGLIADVPAEDGGRRAFNLHTDLALLENAIKSLPDVRLVVIDPVNAFVGTGAMREARLGAVLQELAAFAARHQVAIVAVAHPVRGNYLKPNITSLGAVALNAPARTAFLVHPDPSDPRRNLLLTVKNSLAGSRAALAFGIERREIVPRVSAPVVVWERLPFRLTPDQVIGVPAKALSAKTDARAFLLQLMADKPVLPVPQIEAEARAAGLLPARQPISQCRPLRDARVALRLKVIREGFGQNGRWIWAKEDYKGHVPKREDASPAPAKQQTAKPKQPGKPAAPATTSMEKRTSIGKATSTGATTSMGKTSSMVKAT